MSPSIRMAFEIVAPVFGVALALTLMLSVDRVREHRAHEMAWTFIWVSVCLVGALVFGGFAAFVAWQGFRDADISGNPGKAGVRLAEVAPASGGAALARRLHRAPQRALACW